MKQIATVLIVLALCIIVCQVLLYRASAQLTGARVTDTSAPSTVVRFANSSVPHVKGVYPGAAIEAAAVYNIAHSQKSVHLLAFELTDPAMVSALIAAHVRGIDVAVVLDWSHAAGPRAYHTGIAARAQLKAAGVPEWTLRVSGIMHEKVLIVDGADCMSGSYNWTSGAYKLNCENSREDTDPAIVSQYEANFQALLAAAKAQPQP